MLYYTRADEPIALIPGGKLTTGNASLRLVEEYVECIFLLNEGCLFEWLAVANTNLYFTLLSHFECLARLHPMNLGIINA